MIHIIGLSIAIFALLFWQIKKNSMVNSGVFPMLIGLGILTAGLGLYTASMSGDNKFQFLIMDLIGMGLLGTIFEKLSWKYRTNSTIPIVVVSVLFLLFVYQNIFDKKQYHYPLDLAPDAELLVEIKETYSIKSIQDIIGKYELEFDRAFKMKDVNSTDLDDYYTLNIPADRMQDYAEIIHDLKHNYAVEWLEGNEEISVAPISPERKTPDANKRYGVNDPDIRAQWGLDVMEVSSFYAFLKKNKIKAKKKAVIAILDTGVDSKHEDIQSNFKSTNRKYDTDQQGHGTHCAGIAAAVTNNGKGVASLSWNNQFTRVTSVQVLDRNGMGTQQKIINGILEASDNGVDVISMSLGGRSNQRSQKAYQRAIDYANKKGVIVVAAAGNSNRNAKDFAPVNSKGVIGVSAVDKELNRASFSNYISDIPMGVAAPGVEIYSTLPNNKYASLSGTSMATPYVAGLLGIMKSLKPDLTTKQAFYILEQTGKDTKNTNQTGKLIQPKLVVESLLKF